MARNVLGIQIVYSVHAFTAGSDGAGTLQYVVLAHHNYLQCFDTMVMMFCLCDDSPWASSIGQSLSRNDCCSADYHNNFPWCVCISATASAKRS